MLAFLLVPSYVFLNFLFKNMIKNEMVSATSVNLIKMVILGVGRDGVLRHFDYYFLLVFNGFVMFCSTSRGWFRHSPTLQIYSCLGSLNNYYHWPDDALCSFFTCIGYRGVLRYLRRYFSSTVSRYHVAGKRFFTVPIG